MTVLNLHSLRNGLVVAYDEHVASVNERSKFAALAAVDYLARATPVDSSKALSNWLVVLDNVPQNEIEAHKEGYAGSTRGSSIQATIAAARRVLKHKKFGQRIYVTNLVDYLERLNAGSSTQAPAGFVEASVMIARNEFNKKRGKNVKF